MKKIIIYIILLVLVLIGSYTIINIRNKKINDLKLLEETTIETTETSQMFTSEPEIETETTIDNLVMPLSQEEEAYWESWRREEEEFKKEYFISEESILEMVKPNPNWDKVNISEDKKELLKEDYPNGILNGEEYDDIYIEEGYEYLTQVNSALSTPDTFCLIATKGLKKDKYRIIGTSDFMFKDDFEILVVDKFEQTDENGNPVNSGHPMNERYWFSNLQRIAFQDDEEVGKSERFKREHPNFTGILNPYNFQHTNNRDVKWDEKNSSYEDKIAYCRVHYLEYSEDYDLAITWTLDEKGFLDTCEVKTLRKREHYYTLDDFEDPYSGSVALRLIYKDRKWGRLPLTNNFKKKFNSKDGLFPKYKVVHFLGINLNGRKDNKVAFELLLEDGSKKYVGLIYKIVDEKIDDIEIVELPNIDYSKLSREEIFNMF